MTASRLSRWTRAGLSTVVATGALAGLAATATTTARVPPGLAEFHAQRPEWKPGGKYDHLQCAALVVPMDYRRPGTERITVTISKVPAKNPARRRRVLLFNPGGPGGVGIAQPLAHTDRRIAEVYDLIGFDPRGVGRSTRLECE